jgi:hypothetical protein
LISTFSRWLAEMALERGFGSLQAGDGRLWNDRLK